MHGCGLKPPHTHTLFLESPARAGAEHLRIEGRKDISGGKVERHVTLYSEEDRSRLLKALGCRTIQHL